MNFLFKTGLAVLLIFTVQGCGKPVKQENRIIYKSLKDMSGKTLMKLSQKKIFFGHQSVGNNIIDGIRDIIKDNPEINIKLIEYKKDTDLDNPVFAHTEIGHNNDPLSKINAFREYMEKGAGSKTDIALFKFCFVDIDKDSDVSALFEKYKSTMEILKEKYPGTTFIHATIPLIRQNKNTIGSIIKKALGKSQGLFDNEHNIKRNIYNQYILDKYKGREPVFDIAEIESVHPDGTREFFFEQSRVFYSLFPGYTDDGGHLNKIGRRHVAEQFLLLLLNL